MAGIERIAANTGEELRNGVVFEEILAGRGAVEREYVRSVNGGEDPRVDPRLDPAEVLDPEFERVRVGVVVRVEPEDRRSGAEVEE